MKIIIAGDGKVGALLTRQLSAEGYDLTVIDSNQKVLNHTVEQHDVMAVHGNCASMPVLLQGGVKEADLLIAATSTDEVNLLCCLTAQGINPKLHTIGRIRNPEYSDQIYTMQDFFALSMAVNPEKQAAVEVERLLKYPGFLKRDTFAKGRVEIVELRIDEKSKLCNLSLSDMNQIVKCQVLVCAVLREGVAIMPDGNFVLREKDHIFVTASTRNLTVLLKNLGIITRKVRRVVLCGGGRLCAYLAKELCKSGIYVKIIEKDYDHCVELASKIPDADIIHGDASHHMLLEDENNYDALVSLTNFDELNMIISLYGKEMGIPQTITKLSREENNSMVDTLSLGSIVCPKELCSNNIVRYVRAMENQTGAALAVHSIADGKAEAAEFLVNDTTKHCNTPLKNLKLKKNVLISCITHGAKIEIPNGDSVFVPGDSIVLVTNGGNVIHQLNEIFSD
ncbi:MAG: Trk system potassium transporter TrkA [Eubacteriales bacterium]